MSKIIRLKECNPFCRYRKKMCRCGYNGFNIILTTKKGEDFFAKLCGLPSIEKFCNRREIHTHLEKLRTDFVRQSDYE